MTPEQIAAERHRQGLDRPAAHRSTSPGSGGSCGSIWASRSDTPVEASSALIGERVGNTVLLGARRDVGGDGDRHSTRSDHRHRPPATAFTSPPGPSSVILLSLPPVVLSLALLFVASRTGWFPVGGLPPDAGVETMLRYLRPAGACAGAAGGGDPRTAAGRARSPRRFRIRRCSRRGRAAFRSAALSVAARLQLSLTPVLAVYGVMIGDADQRIVRRRIRHDLARPRPPAVRRA